jgi:hypothetical protein
MKPWRPHELIWIEAALEMKGQERIFAFRDIASMSRRLQIDVEKMANHIEAKRRHMLTLLDWARTQVRAVPASYRAGRRAPIHMAPSELKRPTKSQLMSGRAYARQVEG